MPPCLRGFKFSTCKWIFPGKIKLIHYSYLTAKNRSGRNPYIRNKRESVESRFFTTLLIFIICLSWNGLSLTAQQPDRNPIDSLNNAYNRSGSDSGRATVLIELGKAYLDSSREKALTYFRRSLAMSERQGYEQGKAQAHYEAGKVYYRQSDFALSEENFLKALEITERIKDSAGISRNLNNLGLVAKQTGNYTKALEYYFRSLEIKEKLGDKAGIAATWNNIGLIFYNQDNYKKAGDYFQKCIELNTALGNKKAVASNLNNLALVLIEKGDTARALQLHEQKLALDRESNDKEGMINSLGNLGTIFYEKKEYVQALSFFNEALDAAIQMENPYKQAELFCNIGRVYFRLNDLDRAVSYSDSALNIAKQVRDYDLASIAALTLSDTYSRLGEHAKALSYHKMHASYKDSLLSKQSMEAMAEMEAKYEVGMKDNEILLLNKDMVLKDTQLDNQRFVIYSTAVSLAVALLLGFFIYRNYREKKAANLLLAEKNKEITDSINYSRRIQKVILPSENALKKHFPESFVYYRPKDLVSGDFYFLYENHGRVFIAAADCTGHGVPGALLSMIGANTLNQIVIERQENDPGRILGLLNEAVAVIMQKDETEILSDGMDIALCSIDKNTLELCFSGANRPLWLFHAGQLQELKASKNPIGGMNPGENVYDVQCMQLVKGDSIFLFTDGYPDQFGGPRDKKFTTKKLRSLLAEHSGLPLDQQQIILEETITEWRGGREQTDDILVLGVRV